MVVIKVYTSLLERTVPPLHRPWEALSQPLSACSVGSYIDGQVVEDTAKRAERGWESASYGRRRGGGLSVLRVINILWLSVVTMFEKR